MEEESIKNVRYLSSKKMNTAYLEMLEHFLRKNGFLIDEEFKFKMCCVKRGLAVSERCA